MIHHRVADCFSLYSTGQRRYVWREEERDQVSSCRLFVFILKNNNAFNASNIFKYDYCSGGSLSQSTPSCCSGGNKTKETEATQQQEPSSSCCAGNADTKKTSSSQHVASVFEFLADNSSGARGAMVGHCQTVEGGIQACVWVPQEDDGGAHQHRIVF